MAQINRLFDGNGDAYGSEHCHIIKTGFGCQGSGLSLVFGLRDIFGAIERYTEQPRADVVPLILQRYCNRPLLTRDGFKFDFRVYVVLRSLAPLEFFVRSSRPRR